MNQTTQQTTTDGVRAPSYDTDFEKVILGKLMTAPDGAAPDVLAKVTDRITPEDFYRPRHAELYQAIINAHAAGRPTGATAMAGWLADSGQLERVGGGTLLFECCEAAGGPGDVSHYANRVAELAALRRAQAKGVQIVHSTTVPGRSLDNIADLARQLAEEAARTPGNLDLVQLGSLADECLSDIEHRKDQPKGVATGFIDLDRVLGGGLRPGELTAVAALTGAGKSVLVGDIARWAAVRHGLVVAVFSLEMRRPELFDRQLSALSRVPHYQIKTGDLSDDDWSKMARGVAALADAPLFVADPTDGGAMTAEYMIGQARKLKDRCGRLDLVVIDHMHIMPSALRGADERQKLDDISRRLKIDMAMRLEVPVVTAAQLSRAPTSRTDHRPVISDIKGSSGIEQMCDNIILIYRDDYHDKESPRVGEADFIVAKNRSGPIDTVTVAAQLHLSRFVDMAIV